MKMTLAVCGSLAVGIWGALYCRRYFGSFVTWAFARGDTPRRAD